MSRNAGESASFRAAALAAGSLPGGIGPIIGETIGEDDEDRIGLDDDVACCSAALSKLPPGLSLFSFNILVLDFLVSSYILLV